MTKYETESAAKESSHTPTGRRILAGLTTTGVQYHQIVVICIYGFAEQVFSIKEKQYEERAKAIEERIYSSSD